MEVTVKMDEKMVGIYFTLDYLKRAIDDLEEDIKQAKCEGEPEEKIKFIRGQIHQCYLTKNIIKQFV